MRIVRSNIRTANYFGLSDFNDKGYINNTDNPVKKKGVIVIFKRAKYNIILIKHLLAYKRLLCTGKPKKHMGRCISHHDTTEAKLLKINGIKPQSQLFDFLKQLIMIIMSAIKELSPWNGAVKIIVQMTRLLLQTASGAGGRGFAPRSDHTKYCQICAMAPFPPSR